MAHWLRTVLSLALLGSLMALDGVASTAQSERPVFVGDDAAAREWLPPRSTPKAANDVDCWVTSVTNPDSTITTYSGSELSLDVTVVNLDALLQWAGNSQSGGTHLPTLGITDVVLFLNEREVLNLHPRPESPGDVKPRVLRLRGNNVRVTERVLHFRFDRAPASSAWPFGVKAEEPDKWDAVAMRVSVGLKGRGPVSAQSLDPNDTKSLPITINMLPRWRPSEKVPETALALDSWVTDLVVDKNKAREYGLGDDVIVQVNNAEAYIQWAQAKDKNNATGRTVNKLVLFIDGRPIPGLHPAISGEPYDSVSTNGERHLIVPTRLLHFNLRRTPESNEAWSTLLYRPSFKRDVAVSVGFEDLPPVFTNVDRNSKPPMPMRFVVVPINQWSISGAVLIFTSLVIFTVFAAKSDLIRDTGAPAKPDGWKPFSLARTQMAFWFFLVFSTYFFIFVITGDKDTIPVSVLGLIGVSAATAVGSALVDANARKNIESATTTSAPSAPINRRTEIQRLEKERDAIANDLGKVTGDALTAKQEELKKIQRDLRSLQRSRWSTFVFDLLTENESVSFNRFQICVWTLTLGIIFIKEVWDKLAMPDFSGTLVGLMGISSGTYVALKERPTGKP